MRLISLLALIANVSIILGAPAPTAADVADAAVNDAAATTTAASSTSSNQDYLIIFEKGFNTPDRVVHSVAEKLKSVGAKVHFTYHTVIKGFSVSLSPEAVDTIRSINDSDFPFVLEEDKDAHTFK